MTNSSEWKGSRVTNTIFVLMNYNLDSTITASVITFSKMIIGLEDETHAGDEYEEKMSFLGFRTSVHLSKRIQ